MVFCRHYCFHRFRGHGSWSAGAEQFRVVFHCSGPLFRVARDRGPFSSSGYDKGTAFRGRPLRDAYTRITDNFFKSRIDYEKIRKFDVILEARDQGEPSLSTTAPLHVTVEDVNDLPPRFQHQYYTCRRIVVSRWSSVKFCHSEPSRDAYLGVLLWTYLRTLKKARRQSHHALNAPRSKCSCAEYRGGTQKAYLAHVLHLGV